ncbi:amidase [Enhydrobacter aerosaccus]|uniref:Indoleacetamide hydrolase n=1 Tax=Enhydrobacter aerosaccus TaxID=225324 RepID=A0A1T4T197_9HYPH|nr:amidase [Enhydrobacter aerosaccus]SKA34233.1 amidase [Enhydrobacter aerosaccus]
MTLPADLHYLSLNEIARRLRDRTVSSVELTRAILERIEKVDSTLKSYAVVTPDRALADAAALDIEAAAGRWRGPLHGVPIAVKDLCNTAGIPTAAGMAIHRDHVPIEDATVVTRLKAAGAVILGKLQMTEGAFGAHHPSIPTPLNPWNAAYWTGASSSGSGAATAAGLCYGSLGSDTGGSIRFPSTMNGLSGLKPTWGRVSRAGVFPLAESLDHVGPMARSALDCAMILGVVAGPDPEDPTAVPIAVPDYVAAAAVGVAGRRIGIPVGLSDLDPDSARTLGDAVTVFEKQGAQIVEVRLPAAFQQASRDWLGLCAVETALAHEKTYPSRAAEYGPVLAGLIDMGRGLSAVDYARLQVRRAAVTGGLNTLLASLDLLLMPVMGTAVWSLDRLAVTGRDPEAVAARLRYTAPFDLSGHPTLTLPGGKTVDGMPTGFQIVGRSFDEAGVLAGGHAFQQATDWHLRRPPL